MRALTKGVRVRASWLQAKPLGACSLAGAQVKTTGSFVELVGTCRHFRGDDPVSPTEIRIYLEPDGDAPDPVRFTRPFGCECPGHDRLVEIRPEWVIEVLS